MPGEDARESSERSAGAEDRAQDPIVERNRPDPVQPPEPRLTISGFYGRSDRSGFQRLYLTRDLDYHAEFRDADVVDVNSIPAEDAPFRGEEATQVTLRRDATVEYTWTRKAREVDEFDIDVQFRRPSFRPRGRRAARGRLPDTQYDTCTCHTWCEQETCYTCHTRCETACATQCPDDCVTYFGGPTCDVTCEGPTCDQFTCPVGRCEPKLPKPHPSQIDTACQSCTC